MHSSCLPDSITRNALQHEPGIQVCSAAKVNSLGSACHSPLLTRTDTTGTHAHTRNNVIANQQKNAALASADGLPVRTACRTSAIHAH